MTLEAASYLAGIVAAIAGLASVYYARAQHKREAEKPRESAIVTPPAPLDSPSTKNRSVESASPPFHFDHTSVPNELLHAFETSKGMFNKPARDEALVALAGQAILAGKREFAVGIASELWNKPRKDEVLLVLVKEAVRVADLALAHRATELFFNKQKMDEAKRIIVDSVNYEQA